MLEHCDLGDGAVCPWWQAKLEEEEEEAEEEEEERGRGEWGGRGQGRQEAGVGWLPRAGLGPHKTMNI